MSASANFPAFFNYHIQLLEILFYKDALIDYLSVNERLKY